MIFQLTVFILRPLSFEKYEKNDNNFEYIYNFIFLFITPMKKISWSTEYNNNGAKLKSESKKIYIFILSKPRK